MDIDTASGRRRVFDGYAALMTGLSTLLLAVGLWTGGLGAAAGLTAVCVGLAWIGVVGIALGEWRIQIAVQAGLWLLIIGDALLAQWTLAEGGWLVLFMTGAAYGVAAGGRRLTVERPGERAPV